jgi:MFS family permease
MRAVTRNFGRSGYRDDPRVVLAAAIVVVGMAMGTMFALGVFLRPMQDDLAWGRAEISGVALVTWSMLGIGSFGWGVLSDRVGVRAVVVAGGLQLGLGLILASQASALWHFYLAFGGVAGLAVGAFYAPLTAMAAQWFQANRGLAVALVSAGSGVGAFVVAPVARWLITLYGWRIAMLIVGDLVWLVIVPLGLIVRNRTMSGLQASQESNENAGLPLRQILRVPLFWLIALTHFACCVAHSGPIFHMVAYAMDLGASKMTAATIFGLSSLASVAGRIGSGMVADRYRPGPTLVTLLSIQVPAILLYLVVQSPLSFYALGILFGLAYGGVMPLYALLTREYFGGRAMGGAYGIVFMLQAIGMGLGAYAGGWFYDHMGGYAWSFVAAGTIGVAAVLMAWALRAPLAVRLTAPA